MRGFYDSKQRNNADSAGIENNTTLSQSKAYIELRG
jgi:hypothetical protein